MAIGPAVALIAAICGSAFIAARLISSRTGWAPAGPLVLLAAAPAVPTMPIGFHLSTDDLVPIVGLGLLIVQAPLPRLSKSTLWLIALAAVVLATAARVASSIVNTSDVGSAAAMLAEGVGRPVFLVATAAYVAWMRPDTRRREWVVAILAAVGTFEAAFSLIALAVPNPWNLAVQPIREFETLGGCPGRLIGTLGLSANHLGAVFVLTVPLALGLAIRGERWQRWGWAAASGVQGAALLLTFTRSSILLVIGVSLLFLLYHRQILLALGILATAVAIFIVVTSVACHSPGYVPPPGQTPHPTPSSAEASPAPGDIAVIDRFGDGNDRLALWYSGTRLMLDHPWAGVGLGKTLQAIRDDRERYMNTPFGVATSSAHNTVLLAGAETGVLGALGTLILNIVLALAALIWILGRRDPTLLYRAAGFAVLGYLAQGMVNNLFTVPATSILLAVLVGAFASSAAPGAAADGDDSASTYTPAMPRAGNGGSS
jgi:O-Antigen ligase